MNPKEELSDDLPVSTMILWIADRYNMSKADLSRMFQTTQSTIHYWLKADRISYKNLKRYGPATTTCTIPPIPTRGSGSARIARNGALLISTATGKPFAGAAKIKRL